jgi:hypothetical protein
VPHIANINSSKSFLCEAVLSALSPSLCAFLLSVVFFALFLPIRKRVALELFCAVSSLLASSPSRGRKEWLIVDAKEVEADEAKDEEARVHTNAIPIWGFRGTALLRSSFVIFLFVSARRRGKVNKNSRLDSIFWLLLGNLKK